MSGYRNPLIGNLNINSLRNKIVHLRAKMQLLQLHYSVIGGTKLNDSFPTSQFYLIGYNTQVWKDKNKKLGRCNRVSMKGFPFVKH